MQLHRRQRGHGLRLSPINWQRLKIRQREQLCRSRCADRHINVSRSIVFAAAHQCVVDRNLPQRYRADVNRVCCGQNQLTRYHSKLRRIRHRPWRNMRIEQQPQGAGLSAALNKAAILGFATSIESGTTNSPLATPTRRETRVATGTGNSGCSSVSAKKRDKLLFAWADATRGFNSSPSSTEIMIFFTDSINY